MLKLLISIYLYVFVCSLSDRIFFQFISIRVLSVPSNILISKYSFCVNLSILYNLSTVHDRLYLCVYIEISVAPCMLPEFSQQFCVRELF